MKIKMIEIVSYVPASQKFNYPTPPQAGKDVRKGLLFIFFFAGGVSVNCYTAILATLGKHDNMSSAATL
jgi:hypothetical protein